MFSYLPAQFHLYSFNNRQWSHGGHTKERLTLPQNQTFRVGFQLTTYLGNHYIVCYKIFFFSFLGKISLTPKENRTWIMATLNKKVEMKIVARTPVAGYKVAESLIVPAILWIFSRWSWYHRHESDQNL